jgi:hypothetical protein
MHNLKIGITIHVTKSEHSMWCTGVEQNILNLVKTLSNSSKNYDITLYNTAKDEEYNALILDPLPILSVVDPLFLSYEDLLKSTPQLLIIFGGELSDSDILMFKNKGTKVIYYTCGSLYQISIRDMLYVNEEAWKKRRGIHSFTTLYDAVWTIPQVVPSNYFNKVMHRISPTIVPFLWDPMHILKLLKDIGSSKEEASYTPSSSSKRVTVMEPNKEWIKTFIYPLFIIEDVFRRHPALINTISINNTGHLEKNDMFNHIFAQLDIWKSESVTKYLNKHWNTPIYLKEFTDIVVSHQDNNPLNYFYLDCLYLGYPIVHNASLIKESGYYYNDWDGDEGSHQLISALKYHDKNIEQYNEQSKQTLWKFSANNPEIVEKYDNLILDLFIKKI